MSYSKGSPFALEKSSRKIVGFAKGGNDVQRNTAWNSRPSLARLAAASKHNSWKKLLLRSSATVFKATSFSVFAKPSVKAADMQPPKGGHCKGMCIFSNSAKSCPALRSALSELQVFLVCLKPSTMLCIGVKISREDSISCGKVV